MEGHPPALVFAQRLCGGTWKLESTGLRAELAFTSLLEGAVVEGHGLVFAQGTELHLFSRFGWDPVVKKVFYFDMHNGDAVFFGHVEVTGGLWVNEFQALVGRPGSFVQEATMPGPNLLDSHLYAVKPDGSRELVEHMIFHRHSVA